MRNQHVIVNGIDVQYVDQGSGPVVLLLHGWGTNLATFDGLISFWTDQGKRFVALDLPGFGGSSLPSVAWDVSAYASFVKDFLLKLDIAQPEVIVGHSLGGRISIKGISAGYFKSKYLVLIASAGTAKTKSFKKTFFFIVAKIGKFITNIPPLSFFRSSLKRKLYAATGTGDYLNSGKMKGAFLKIIQENLEEDARKIDVPTLLIWGSDDTQTPLSEGLLLHGLISGSEMEVFRGAGHFVHQDRSKEVAERISTFTKI